MSIPPPELCDRARQTKDPRFDGLFFTGVRTTRIFCRPVCPAPTPKPQNIVYFATAAAAAGAGFRPCLRCRPELAPGVRPSDTAVSRALHLITEGFLRDASVDALARRVAVSPRHLRRLFIHKMGATPIEVHQTQRLLLAKQLLSDSTLSMTQVALAAGYSSVRRFNAAFRVNGGRAPSAIRRGSPPAAQDELTLRIDYRPPFDFAASLAMLRARASPRVECIGDGCYERILQAGPAPRWIRVTASPGKHQLCLRAFGVQPKEIQALVHRVRRMFDLDADMRSVRDVLSRDRGMCEMLCTNDGVRLVGGWCGFETAVGVLIRASADGANGQACMRALITSFGEPSAPSPAALDRSFPSPERLAVADLEGVCGVTCSAAAMVRRLCAAVRDDSLSFGPGQLLDDFVARCTVLTGMSAATAESIALHAMVDPDAFPIESLIASPDTVESLRRQQPHWRPWRAYALMQYLAKVG
jgi:AraC family transcriptional regulator of adaptative response / DNA-3-methyladenine glycosylase II